MATTELRGRIVDAAVELFNREGCRAVTMERIAGSIRISKRTLYEVFATKDELVLSCLTRVEGTLGRLPAESEAWDALEGMLYIMERAVETNVRYARLLGDSERYYAELGVQLMRSVEMRLGESLRRLMERAAEAGDLREGVDIDLSIEIMTRCIMRGCHTAGVAEGKGKAVKMLKESCFTYLRGLLSEKKRRKF